MRNRPTVIIVSEVMPMGGTSNFALNLSSGMRETGNWTGVVAVMRSPANVIEEARKRGLPLIDRDDSLVLHEERIERMYRECAPYAPQAAIGALSSGSFDFLRYAPSGCLRIAMIQSDDEGVYLTVLSYLDWIDLVVGVSSEICRNMEQRLTASNRVPVIHQPYGVPMPALRRPIRAHGPLRVLYLGRISEAQKRVSLMARVIRKTLAACPDLIWTIAGDGPDTNAFKADLGDTDKRVHFLGPVPYEQVPEILAEQDVYFLCSDFEGLPLSLLEAMGAGLVPVVSDLPSGISEVVSDHNGIRVKVDDEKGYVDAVLQLASDRERLMELSAAAPEAVRHSHSTMAMTKRWEEMLNQHISEVSAEWKSSCKATVPVTEEGKWHLQPWLRPMRTMFKRLRKILHAL